MASSPPSGSRQRRTHPDRYAGAAAADLHSDPLEAHAHEGDQLSPDRVARFAFTHPPEEDAQSTSGTIGSSLLQETAAADETPAARPRPAKAPLRSRATTSASHHSNTCTSCSIRLLWMLVVLHSLLLGALITERTCTVEFGTADWPWITAVCSPATHHDQRIAALEAALAALQQQLADHGDLVTRSDRSVDEQTPTAGPSARTLLLWADDRTTRPESVRSFSHFVETELASSIAPTTAVQVVTLDRPALSASTEGSNDSEGGLSLSIGPLPITAGPCLLLFLHSAVSNKVTDLFDKHAYMQLQNHTTEACPVVFVVLRQLSENSGESNIEPHDLTSGAADRQLFLEFRHRHHAFYPGVQDSWNKAQLQRLRDEWDQQEQKPAAA